jgi:RNA polymerase sigma-70 factor (ECF subfamily)
MDGIASGSAIDRSDAELAADGNEAAFARLVADHYGDMARVAYVITGDRALAEDALQAAWISAWQKLRGLREPSRIRPWLLAIAVNEARQVMRRRRRVVVMSIDPEVRAAPRTDPAAGIERIDLQRAIARLSPDDRALLALRYLAGLDMNEIAALTGRSASGTRGRLSRLTTRLRGELDDD